MVDRIERSKDLVQELVESTASHVGQIAIIITGAVADVAREVGEIITDGFEMREASRRAKLDDEHDTIDASFVADLDPIEHHGPAPEIDTPSIDPSSAPPAIEGVTESGPDEQP